MIILTVEEVLQLHDRLLTVTGGAPGLRDAGLLASAVHSVSAGYEEVERYPSVEEKAARLAYALTQNHAFVDGNKRIGVFAMLVTLELNAVRLSYSQQELIALGLGVADGSLGYEDVLQWIHRHK